MKKFFPIQIIIAFILLFLTLILNKLMENYTVILWGFAILLWNIQSISCCIYFYFNSYKNDTLSRFKWIVMGLLSLFILLDIFLVILFFSGKILNENIVYFISTILSFLFLITVIYALIFYIKNLYSSPIFNSLFRDALIAYVPVIFSLYYNFQSIFLSRYNILKFINNKIIFISFNIEQLSLFLFGFLLLFLFMSSFYIVRCKRSNFILVFCFLFNNVFYFININLSDTTFKNLFELQPVLTQFLFTLSIILGAYFNLKDKSLINKDMNDKYIHSNNIWISTIIATMPIFFSSIYLLATFIFKINLNIYKYLFLDILCLILVLYRDIIIRKENYKLITTIRKHSKTDSLTGLNNRTEFTSKVSNWQTPYTLFFFDIRKFKDINDIYGHDIGDLVLKLVSKTLDETKNSMFYNSCLCRYGGDEFIFAICTSNKIYIDYLSKLFLEEKELYLKDLDMFIPFKLNVGYSINDNNKALDILLKEADYAMYKSKLSDTPISIEFNNSLNTEYTELNILKKDLRNAIYNKEIFLVFQPKICLKTNKIIGFESLCRWNHKNIGYIPTSKFINIAEQAGIIYSLDLYIFKKACEFQKYLIDKNINLKCSINLSLKSLRNPSIVNSFNNIIEKVKVPANTITLELLESVAMDDNLILLNQIEKLKKLGFLISIDDFGTDYSSLNRLFSIPFDELKIPKNFIAATPNNRQLAILKSVSYLAKQLKVYTVVEGIETKEQLFLFKSLEFDSAQGYYYSEPLTKNQFIDYIVNYNYHFM